MEVSRHRRWLVVGALVALAVAVPVVSGALPASTSEMDPARLRDMILRSADVPHQGYAESSGRMAVPELPKLASVTSLLSGTTRVRSWYESPARFRYDVVTTTGEQDLYRTSDSELTWKSGEKTVAQVFGDLPVRLPRAGDLLPPDLARRILAAAPGDTVTAIAPKRVAGTSAAGLRLQAKDPDTTIGHVDIWADPATGVPLQVELTAKNAAKPVLTTRFLEYSATPPAADVLTPDLAPDVYMDFLDSPDITEILGSFGLAVPPERLAGRDLRTDAVAGIPGIGLYGTGLSSFVVLQLPRDVARSAIDAATKAGAREANNSMLLEIPPLSLAVVRSTTSRRTYLLAGFVSPQVLEQAGAQLSVLPRGGR
jgi:hypothetical protein